MNKVFKVTLASLFIAFLMSVNAHSTWAANAAYIVGTNPWGTTTNDQQMTRVFGPIGSGWDRFNFTSGVSAFSTGSGYNFIFLEGSSPNAPSLNGFLNANRTEIESWVLAGGHLLLNAAPNRGGNIDFGFGGIILHSYTAEGWGVLSRNVSAVDPAHAIFNGPFLPVGTSYSGNYFAHGYVTGLGVNPIISGIGSRMILGEKPYGSGLVLVGNMTASSFHSPRPNGDNLLGNIIQYTAGGLINCALSGISLNGSPASIANPVNMGGQCILRMTNNLSQAGGAFLTRPISLANNASFRTSFKFQITNPIGGSDIDGQGADGLVFVMQTQSFTYGEQGGGIGYQYILKSVGIEFDTWNNQKLGWDYDGNHVGINLNGNIKSIAKKHIPDRMNNGKVWNARIYYDGVNKELFVWLSEENKPGPESLTLSSVVDVPDQLVHSLGYKVG